MHNHHVVTRDPRILLVHHGPRFSISAPAECVQTRGRQALSMLDLKSTRITTGSNEDL